MKLNDRLKYAVPMIITALMLCLVYVLKGIYPFGKNTIDYYDMAQQIAAFYYHTFDFLHGQKNLFYDPYTALSVNMAMSTSGCSHLSIFNLFFLFVKREALLESLSIFLMLKMMFMSLFMYIYVHNRYRISFFYEVAFSVGYAFCGYVLMLYMTIQWLDVAALFPLLMLFLHYLLKDGKSYGYITVLTIMIIASYYQSFMILMYIVLMVGAAMLTDRVFEKGGDHVLYKEYHLLKLFFSTVISLVLSSFIVLPQIKQTLNSARFNNENGGGLLSTYYEIVSTVKPAYTSRWWSLLGLSFAFAVIMYGLFIYRKEKKVVTITLFILFIILSELVVEGVNLFWHFGSYVGYPIRNGYMIYFTVACLACGFLEKTGENEENKGNSLSIILTVVATASIIGAICFYSGMTGLSLRDVFHLTTAVMAIAFTVHIVILFINKGIVCKTSYLLMAAEVILFGFIMIGKPAYSSANTEDPEQEGDYIQKCIQLDEAFSLNAVDFDDDGESRMFSRVKNPDTTLNANYGLILRRPVLSNWTHLLSPLLQRDAAKLGYSIQYTRLLDSGGTVFSDALLGIKEVISVVPLDEELYELKDKAEILNGITGEKETYYLYNCKYALPFGIVTDSIDYDFENGTIADIYNEIYRSITGNTDIIAESMSCDSVSISGKKALYYFSNQVDTDDYNTEIFVNGKKVAVPSIGEADNTLYPAHFNNNALYLGTFENEKIDLKLNISDSDRQGKSVESEIKPMIMSIDLDELSKLTSTYSDVVTDRKAYKSGYDFNINARESNTYFLIPLSYDNGYEVSVNGNKSDMLQAGGIFSAVYLNKGVNNISIRFIPDGMRLGIIISLTGIIGAIIYILFDKKSSILDTELKWLNKLYGVMFMVTVVFMYVVPYIFTVLTLVHVL